MRYDVARNFDYPTMTQEPISQKIDASGLRVAIVVARFHTAITEKLVAGARRALAESNAEGIDVFEVPGSFELPLAAKTLACARKHDAIIALGCVIRGETPHFDYVANEAARGLQQAALDSGVPVAFGVLTTDNLAQAEDRAGGAHGNKGYDAAQSAVEMARLLRRIRAV
jgi:6,7-dimethyl-8-ribityllumazine synthase